MGINLIFEEKDLTAGQRLAHPESFSHNFVGNKQTCNFVFNSKQKMDVEAGVLRESGPH